MAGLRFAVFFCVLIIQRVASQTCNTQTELFISVDDLMKAINNGPGFPGLIETNNQACGRQPPRQPSCQNNQQCSCQQPQTALALGQPTFSISGFNLGNQCGCQQPQISQPSQSSCQSLQISKPSQQCGCQSLQINQPSQCGCQSIQISQPSCGCQQNQQLTISNPTMSFQPISMAQPSQTQQKPQPKQIKTESVPSCIIPAALLQAPPYGILFAGDNLLIDGAVQVCGNMPFNSIIELGGVMPSSGSGCVQYSCGDSCAICA
ncbi:uncharacterized protein LOC133532014 [Cydia pomonella]|uniref:uncharacterized protein LOC133532014 n=1 Tax=Cydia pomonella TaxID=82600 RepID=UPI002ADDEB90|nr:uncharacterized protein LOC133532014 [Cydia pomonella]